MALQQNVIECNGEKFDHYYLCHYRPQSSGSDKLSQSLIRFKNGWSVDGNAWMSCSIEELQKITFKGKVLLLRALHSNEITVSKNSNTSLDRLCRSIGQEMNFIYRPEFLGKKRKTRPAKLLSRSDRETELHDVYLFSGKLIDFEEILVVDDILTTGQTLRAIMKAIRSIMNCPITLYTLACTDHQSILNITLQLRSPAYRWEPRQGWGIAQDSKAIYSSLQALKHQILSDFLE